MGKRTQLINSLNPLSNDGHCADPTAYIALRQIQREEKIKVKKFKRIVRKVLKANGLYIKGGLTIVSRITGQKYIE